MSIFSADAIWNYEKNKRKANIEVLKNIADALNTNVYNLLDNSYNLTSKLIKLFEETICESMDATNTLEVICESIDIDDEEKNIQTISEGKNILQKRLYHLAFMLLDTVFFIFYIFIVLSSYFFNLNPLNH